VLIVLFLISGLFDKMIYVIRHGEKAYTNNERVRFPFDAPLTNNGIRILKSMDPLNELTTVYCSPYLRCRMTARIIAPAASLIIDVRLSEYLGHQRCHNKHRKLTKNTRLYNPPLYYEHNSDQVFKHNIKDFYHYIVKTADSNSLVVTHGYCIKVLKECDADGLLTFI
jgi:broad specificity phosphatase PhoE